MHTDVAINVSVQLPPLVSKVSVGDLIVLKASKSNLNEHTPNNEKNICFIDRIFEKIII